MITARENKLNDITEQKKPSTQRIAGTTMGFWVPIADSTSFFLKNLQTQEKISLPPTTLGVYGLNEEKMLCVESLECKKEREPVSSSVASYTIKIATLYYDNSKNITDVKPLVEFKKRRVMKKRTKLPSAFDVDVSPDGTRASMHIGVNDGVRFYGEFFYLINVTTSKVTILGSSDNIGRALFPSPGVTWCLDAWTRNVRPDRNPSPYKSVTAYVNNERDSSVSGTIFPIENSKDKIPAWKTDASPDGKFIFFNCDNKRFLIHDLSLGNFPESTLKHLYTFPSDIIIKQQLWVDDGMVFAYDKLSSSDKKNYGNGIAKLNMDSWKINQITVRCSRPMTFFKIHLMEKGLPDPELLVEMERKDTPGTQLLKRIPLKNSTLLKELQPHLPLPDELKSLVALYAKGDFKTPNEDMLRYYIGRDLMHEIEKISFFSKMTINQKVLQTLRLNLKNKTQTQTYTDCLTKTFADLGVQEQPDKVIPKRILSDILELDAVVEKNKKINGSNPDAFCRTKFKL